MSKSLLETLVVRPDEFDKRCTEAASLLPVPESSNDSVAIIASRVVTQGYNARPQELNNDLPQMGRESAELTSVVQLLIVYRAQGHSMTLAEAFDRAEQEDVAQLTADYEAATTRCKAVAIA